MTRTCFTLLLTFATLFAWADDYWLSAQTPNPSDDTLSLDAEVYLPSTVEPAVRTASAEWARWHADVPRVAALDGPLTPPMDAGPVRPPATPASGDSSLYVLMSLQR